MKMQYCCTSEGIKVEKNHSSRIIPFADIHRVELDMEGESFFVTKDREHFEDKHLYTVLSDARVYEAIRENNIAFIDRYMKQFHTKTYKEEELPLLFEEPKQRAQEIADKYIKEHFGPEYSVDVVIDKDFEHYQMYFNLKKDGEIVGLPKEITVHGGKKVSTAFESMIITDFLEWKTDSRSAVYGLSDELTDPFMMEFHVEDKMKDFCERYEQEKKNIVKKEEVRAAKPVERPEKKDHLLLRYPVFLVGLFIASLGVAFSTVAELGTSPVASVPYSVFLADGGNTLSFGGWLNLLSVIQITVQVLILRRKSDPLEITIQTILAFVYGYLTNFSCWLLRDVFLVTYGEKLLFMLLGCVILALGIWIQFKGGVAMLPGEAMNRAISQVTKKRYENVKIFFDIFYITLAAIICMVFLGKLEGVREGSIVAAILVGMLIKLYNRIWNNVTGIMKKTLSRIFSKA